LKSEHEGGRNRARGGQNFKAGRRNLQRNQIGLEGKKRKTFEKRSPTPQRLKLGFRKLQYWVHSDSKGRENVR